MTFEQLKKDLSEKKYNPIYFLWGEEAFFIDYITNIIENNVLLPQDRDFNQTVFYGNDSSAPQIIDVARRFPMLAANQVVIVKEAQYLKDIDMLAFYLSHFQPSTILVVAYKGNPDKRKNLFKQALSNKNCIVFDSKSIPENKLPEWIVKYCNTRKRGISAKGAAIIASNLGNDLSKVVNELDKLMLTIPEKGTLTEDAIEKNIGISKDFNVFELVSQVSKKDYYKANLIVNYFASNAKRHPFVLTIGALFRYFNNLLTYHYQKRANISMEQLAKDINVNPYFIGEYTIGATKYSPVKCAQIIELIRTYDMKSKGIGVANANEGELLKELIFRIMN